MEQMLLNQTALALGYIALKRIRALEEHTSKPPSNPLLRHLGHIKILAACVDQVGPGEIIEYEINQDTAFDDSFGEQLEHISFASGAFNSFDRSPKDFNHRISGSQFSAIRQNHDHPISLQVVDQQAESGRDTCQKLLIVTNITDDDVDEGGDYSMDELYDQYNSQEDDWETASDVSDASDENGSFQNENVGLDTQSTPSVARKPIDSDSEDDDIVTPRGLVISRSPPLDITKRHPITNEINRREQYRRADPAVDQLSCAWVEQIEDVLSNEIRCLSLRNSPGRIRLGAVNRQTVSVCA